MKLHDKVQAIESVGQSITKGLIYEVNETCGPTGFYVQDNKRVNRYFSDLGETFIEFITNKGLVNND